MVVLYNRSPVNLIKESLSFSIFLDSVVSSHIYLCIVLVEVGSFDFQIAVEKVLANVSNTLPFPNSNPIFYI